MRYEGDDSEMAVQERKPARITSELTEMGGEIDTLSIQIDRLYQQLEHVTLATEPRPELKRGEPVPAMDASPTVRKIVDLRMAISEQANRLRVLQNHLEV